MLFRSEAVKSRLDEGDAIFEGNPYVAAALLDEPRLADVNRLGVFIAPVTREELEALRDDDRVDAEATLTDVMRRKLLRRARRHKGELSRVDLDDVENRAGRAYRELAFAPRFDHVIPNHDGEDSEHWHAFPLPLGDARRTLHALIALLGGRSTPPTEAWDDGLFA